MSNDIRDIIERLAILEGRITPVDVKHGLNADQKSVKQLPALFKPKDISPTLSKTPYQKHPMDGWLVGEEDEEADKEVVEEAKVDEEKLLDKVKKSLTDYLQSVEEKLEKKIDRDLGEKPAARDIGAKDKTDRDLVAAEQELEEDPTEEDPVIQAGTTPVENPTYAESACVKSMVLENGAMFEIHGNERTGFEIRHGNRTMKSRFKNIDEAAMAIEMFRARQKKDNQSQDYIEEA
jgi:LPS O-antigen subunit length determinant protein (WzzB/FepE family)